MSGGSDQTLQKQGLGRFSNSEHPFQNILLRNKVP